MKKILFVLLIGIIGIAHAEESNLKFITAYEDWSLTVRVAGVNIDGTAIPIVFKTSDPDVVKYHRGTIFNSPNSSIPYGSTGMSTALINCRYHSTQILQTVITKNDNIIFQKRDPMPWAPISDKVDRSVENIVCSAKRFDETPK